MAKADDQKALLKILGGKETPNADQLKQLLTSLDSHEVLAKVFLLEGAPFVFKESPMKYVIFREQVAERFGVGSQDVCIVGSAKLGYSPSPHKYGTPFSETSDVDVVIISEPLFFRGSRELFAVLERLDPPLYQLQKQGKAAPTIPLENWKKVKEAVRNFVYQNFNPGLLPYDHPLRAEIFNKISSTSGLFLALEPQVFVSTIRCRIFRHWKAAEDYYANSLRQAKFALLKLGDAETDPEEDDAGLAPAPAAPTTK